MGAALCGGGREARTAKGVRSGPDGEVERCVFCDYASGVADEDGQKRELLYEDEHCVAFESRAADASRHLLVVPRAHIRDCNAEGLPDVLPLLVRAAGRLAPGAVMCFHRPPFTSVDHLHLHVLVPPFRACHLRFKHEPAPGKFWSVDPRTLLRPESSDSSTSSSS